MNWDKSCVSGVSRSVSSPAGPGPLPGRMRRSALCGRDQMAQSAAVGRDSVVCLRQPGAVPAGDVLAAWAERTGRRRAAVSARGGLRFAFYGRVSTEDWQDPVASRARQRDQAAALVAGHGRIVAGFFDVGYSRALAWARRLQAAALVAALADPDRGWDAIVIGEYERAFYGSQYASMAPLFEHYGIQLWTPEAGGRIGYGTEDHEQMMLALGYQSRREIARTKIRVRTAMATQTREQGRYLGGRPPYGYQLADAGPHPDKAHAAWGQRARLAPDPATRRCWRGCSPSGYRATASRGSPRALNDAAVPCPSAAGPQRNPHRAGTAWTLGSVAAILANPRYTGRQVWNRQRTDFDLTGPASTGLGHRPVQRWNLPAGWVISAHPAIVGEAGYIAVQDVSAARGPRRPGHPPLPAGGAAALRPVRAAAGVGLVQRQARLPVPPRVHQRRRARARPAEERAHPRGPDPAPADGPGHPPGSRKPCPGRREPGQRQEHCSRSGRRPDRSPAGRRRQHHLRPSHAGADPGHDGSARRSWPTDARGARHGPGRRPGPPGCPRRSARG